MHHRTPSLVSGFSTETPSGAASASVIAPTKPGYSGNPNSIAHLVYGPGRENLAGAYRPPTTRDIPQLKLKHLHNPDEKEFTDYVASLGKEFDDALVSAPPETPLQPLETVPPVFFSPDFHLDNPRVFEDVCQTRGDLPDYTILLEKLSWYIDIVELHLIDNISSASSSFFQVTGHFNAIETEAAECTQKLVELKSTVAKIAEFVNYEQDTLKLVEKLENIDKLLELLDQISVFVNSVDEAEACLANDNATQCARLLNDATRLGDSLAAVRCVSHKFEKIALLRSRVGAHYQKALISLLITDLNQHIDSVPTQDTLNRMGRILHFPGHHHHEHYNHSYATVTPEFKQSLQSILSGAIETHSLDAALAGYREEVSKELKALVRQNLPQAPRSEDIDKETATLDKRLNSLSTTDALKLYAKLYTSVSEAFNRLATQLKLLLDLSSSMGSVPSNIGDMLETLVTVTDSRIRRIIKVRRDKTASLSVREFIQVYALTGIFMSECERICGIYAPELSAFLASQTKLYIEQMHNRNLSFLRSTMDYDQWKKEAPQPGFQDMIDTIIESANEDPTIWMKEWRGAIDGVEEVKHKQQPVNVLVNQDSFYISKSAARLLVFVQEELELICLLPQTANELCDDIFMLIKTFNDRTRALILGTGAMSSGSGLKRITFRHLSLAYESLRFVGALLPSVEACVQRHITGQELINQWQLRCQDLANTLNTHRQDIRKKFTNIMTDKAERYARALNTTNWSLPSDPCNTYMQNLVKDLSTVAKILGETLPKSDTLAIVGEIFAVYKPKLLQAFMSLQIHSAGAKENVLKDILYFRDHAKQIDGAGNIGDILYETMKEFSLADDLPPATPPKDHLVQPGDTSIADTTIEAKSPERPNTLSLGTQSSRTSTDSRISMESRGELRSQDSNSPPLENSVDHEVRDVPQIQVQLSSQPSSENANTSENIESPPSNGAIPQVPAKDDLKDTAEEPSAAVLEGTSGREEASPETTASPAPNPENGVANLEQTQEEVEESKTEQADTTQESDSRSSLEDQSLEKKVRFASEPKDIPVEAPAQDTSSTANEEKLDDSPQELVEETAIADKLEDSPQEAVKETAIADKLEDSPQEAIEETVNVDKLGDSPQETVDADTAAPVNSGLTDATPDEQHLENDSSLPVTEEQADPAPKVPQQDDSIRESDDRTIKTETPPEPAKESNDSHTTEPDSLNASTTSNAGNETPNEPPPPQAEASKPAGQKKKKKPKKKRR